MNSGYLVDTSVLSLLAPGRRESAPQFVLWFAARDRDLHISTVTAAEIERGIAKLRRTGASTKAALYADWFERVLAGFGTNTIPVDTIIARLSGYMIDAADGSGQSPGLADALIAATAKTRELTVLTRNLKHFLPLGVEAIDPILTLPR